MLSVGKEVTTTPPLYSNSVVWCNRKKTENRRRKVYILLTRFPDLGSKIIGLMTGFYYTHASIGLEDDKNTFYSFVTKGFIVEKIDRYIRPEREPYPCRLYEIEVTNEVYEKIKSLIRTFLIKKENLRYAKLGVALCMFRISYQSKNHYFCSQFVADILKDSGAVHLDKDTTLFLPKDFGKLNEVKYVFSGNIRSLLCCSPA